MELQQQSHWLSNEINLSSDVDDWKMKLNSNERHLIGQTLKGFTQAEILIGDYWTNKVNKWFKHPEIQMMGRTFGSFEDIHITSYAKLNDTLGLDDYTAFLSEPTTKNKIDRLIENKGKTKGDIAKSLAIFSAFNEGVNLFSSFAILLNFSRFNKMKGLGQIIALSIKDESLHSQAGCWLYRTFLNEYPEVNTDEHKASIYEAARVTIELEDAFIENAFSLGDVEGLSVKELKNFLRHRCNTKLQDLGLRTNWKNIDKELLKSMDWFDLVSFGQSHTDFFAQRETEYSKSNINWSDLLGDK